MVQKIESLIVDSGLSFADLQELYQLIRIEMMEVDGSLADMIAYQESVSSGIPSF